MRLLLSRGGGGLCRGAVEQGGALCAVCFLGGEVVVLSMSYKNNAKKLKKSLANGLLFLYNTGVLRQRRMDGAVAQFG